MKKLLIAMAFATLEELLEERNVPVEYREAVAKLFQTILKRSNVDTLLAKEIKRQGMVQ